VRSQRCAAIDFVDPGHASHRNLSRRVCGVIPQDPTLLEEALATLRQPQRMVAIIQADMDDTSFAQMDDAYNLKYQSTPFKARESA